MGKGEETRQAILDEAFSLASCIGVSGLSIGVLAERTHMSKSGLFAHFGSKEELQLAVLRESQQRFAEAVLRPALREPRGRAGAARAGRPAAARGRGAGGGTSAPSPISAMYSNGEVTSPRSRGTNGWRPNSPCHSATQNPN